jgi:hypothetical protein
VINRVQAARSAMLACVFSRRGPNKVVAAVQAQCRAWLLALCSMQLLLLSHPRCIQDGVEREHAHTPPCM